MKTTLITLAEFTQLEDAFVIDCSYDLTDAAAGRAAFDAGHWPGAVYFDLATDLSGPKHGQPPTNGRHPLPARAAFAERLAQAGCNALQQVVVYDRSSGMFAARCWWMLRWLGHEAVALLDGGLPSSHATQSKTSAFARGSFVASGSKVSYLLKDDVAQNLRSKARLLLDARAPERFSGQLEPLDPVPGHIPGALNRFFKLNLEASGHFKSQAQLRQEYLALMGKRSASELVMQCGSGATACHNILALAHAGLGHALLYPGSYSEWCADTSLPVSQSA